MNTKTTIIVSSIISAVMTLPPYLWGALDPMQAAIAGVYSLCSAAAVCLFAPQLVKF